MINGDFIRKINNFFFFNLPLSHAVSQVFGYTRKEIEGKCTINILMPRLYTQSHEGIIKNYMNTGKVKCMYSQRKIFCLTKFGYMFPGWKFVK